MSVSGCLQTVIPRRIKTKQRKIRCLTLDVAYRQSVLVDRQLGQSRGEMIMKNQSSPSMLINVLMTTMIYVLVVDTTGFNGRGWTGLSRPASGEIHRVKQYRITSYGGMELELTDR